MATDIAKLMILVEAKGGKEAKDELDKVSKGTDNVKASTEKMNKTNKESASIFDIVRGSLTQAAAGYYLLQQGVGLLKRAWDDTAGVVLREQEAYTKLDTILRSTGEAVGYNTDQLNTLAETLSKQNAYSEAVVLNTLAIGASFTQLGQEIFPEVIQQTFNLSRAFGNDLKSTMIQVGKAINDPIRGVSALSDVGVTFNEVQRKQIKEFISMNDLMSAQKVILDELEREVGGVAEAYARTDSGKIDALTISMENFNKSLGRWLLLKTESPIKWLTEFFDNEADTASINQANTDYKNFIKTIQDANRVGESTILQSPKLLEELPESTMRGRIEFLKEQNNLIEKQGNIRLASPLIDPETDETLKRLIDDYKDNLAVIEALTKAIELKNKAESGGQAPKDAGLTAEDLAKADRLEAYLRNLRMEYDLKNKLMGITGEDAELQRELAQVDADWAKLRADAWYNYGMTLEELIEITGDYHTKRKKQLMEEYQLEQQLLYIQKTKTEFEKISSLRGTAGLPQQDAEAELTQKYWEDMRKIQDLKNQSLSMGKDSQEFLMRTEDAQNALTEQYIENLRTVRMESSLVYTTLKDINEQTKDLVVSYASSMLVESFTQMGEALGGFNDEGESFSVTMARMVADMTSALSTMFVTAGLQVIIKNPTDPATIALGVSLMALGGVTGIYSGYLGNKVDEASQSISPKTINQLPPTIDTDTANSSRTMLSNTSGSGVVNNVYNSTGQEVQTRTSVNSKGQTQTDIFIGKLAQGMTRSIMTKTNTVPVGIPLTTGH